LRAKHRKALRAAGIRPIQIWVPDVRSKSFAAQARRQSLAVAKSPQEQDDLVFRVASVLESFLYALSQFFEELQQVQPLFF
jgi:hypothetical protein